MLELEAVFEVNVNEFSENAVLIKTSKNIKEIQNQLGGVIKIARVIDSISESDIDEIIIRNIQDKNSEGKKWTLSLNYYGPKKENQFLRNHLMKIKKNASFPMRFCNKDFSNVSSVVTRKQIIDKGMTEINVFQTGKDEYLISETITCQDIESYSDRDYGKPVRDARIGMIPPKLAQIMLNISGDMKSIWDPFCGTGTIPMEALLMGKEVISSDISKDMIIATEKNLDWLQYKFGVSDSVDLFEHDAKNYIDIKVDAVITEGYLGPPKSKPPDENEHKKTDAYLVDLYSSFFNNIKKNKIKTIVLCLPVYKMEEKIGFMGNTLNAILRTGYKQYPLGNNRRLSVLYYRKDQYVLREVLKFVY